MRAGYAHIISPTDQDAEQQLQALQRAGVQKMFSDHGVAGGSTKRPELLRCLQTLQRDDVLVVWKLDRLAHSLHDLIEIINDLGKHGIKFLSLTDAINTTAAGNLIFHTFSALAEFERNQTQGDMMAARARAVKSVPQPKSSTQTLILVAAQKLMPGWFVPSNLQVFDPQKDESLSRRSRDWAIRELVREGLLEQGTRVTSGRKGKPARQYRVVAKSSGVAALNGLCSQS
jgi:hypothetical protein